LVSYPVTTQCQNPEDPNITVCPQAKAVVRMTRDAAKLMRFS